MPSPTAFRVLDAATTFAVEIGQLVDASRASRRSALEGGQLRRAADSVGANIAEAFGRAAGSDRNHFLRIARGSTEEALQHLRLNYRSGRLARGDYYRVMNRGVVIVRMLNALIGY